MIATLIILILIVIFLAFFIGLNISNACTFWFFKTYENVPVVTLAFIAFAAGVIVALLIVLITKLKLPSSAGVEYDQKKAEKEEKLKDKKLRKEIKQMEAKNKKNRKAKDNVYAQSSSSDNTIITNSGE
ncbi:MAG: LapA family protein [Treponema sp.]|nr:LapA family protein [Treponema sp.]